MLDLQLLTRAVDVLNRDGEYRLHAGGWSGPLRLEAGDERWQLEVRRGQLSPPAPGWRDPAEGAVTVSGSTELWAQFLSRVPPAPCTDFFGATLVGMRVEGPVLDAARHLVLRRLGEVLRLLDNGQDTSPATGAPARKHGEVDQATGRYVYLEIDEVVHRVYFEEAGSGIPLLCQHTAGSDGRQWRHLLEDPRVTDRFRVIAYDLPYHGKSLPPEGRAWWAEPYRLTKDFAMAVPCGLADALGLDRPAFIGSSVGGMLALDLARYHPEKFRAVIACEAGLYLGQGAERRSEDEAEALMSSSDPAVHAASMMSWMGAPAPERYRQETRLHYAQGAPGVFPGDIYYFGTDHDLRGEGHLVDTGTCPVFMLTGEYDFVTIPASEEAHRQIPGSSYQVMEGMGHFPMSEDPERFAGYVLPILDQISTATVEKE